MMKCECADAQIGGNDLIGPHVDRMFLIGRRRYVKGGACPVRSVVVQLWTSIEMGVHIRRR